MTAQSKLSDRLLQNDDELRIFLKTALEGYLQDQNQELFFASIRQAIISKGGLMVLAKKTNLSRQRIYRMLNRREPPTLLDVGLLLQALGLQIHCN